MERERLRLIYEQPFFATVLNKCIIKWDDAIGTAGVRVNQNGQVEMLVSSKFYQSLTDNAKVGLLMHELLHVTMKHRARSADLDHKLSNIAQDIAINQFIPKHLVPPGTLLPEKYSLPRHRAFEYYYLALLEQSQSQEVSGETLDNHDLKNELTEEMTDTIVNGMLEQSVKETIDKFGVGAVPNHIQAEIDSRLRPAQVNWKQVLRRFVGSNLSDHKETTRTRANRRLGQAAPGYKRDYVPRVVIACDQSGSVDDTMLNELLSEAKAILRSVADKTEVVYFDTQVAKVAKLSDISKVERFARGGTNFNCIMEYVKGKQVDLLIMLTDGEAPAPQANPKCPVLWCLSGNYDNKNLKGLKVKLARTVVTPG